MTASNKKKGGLKNSFRTSQIFPGKKYEYSISPAPDYWNKFCDDEEKKLIIVRNPFHKLSYHSFSKIHPSSLTFSKSRADDRKASGNSLHEFSSTGSKSKLKNEHTKKSFSSSLVKRPAESALRVPVTARKFSATSKIVRTAKLNVQSPQPSSSKISPGRVARIREPFSAQNKPRVACESSSTLLVPDTVSEPSNLESTSSECRTRMKLPGGRDPDVANETVRRLAKDKTEKPSERAHQTLDQENHGEPTDEECLKYSARFAYKALKRVTKNKNLYFGEKRSKHISRDSSSRSNDSPGSDHAELDSNKAHGTGDHRVEASSFIRHRQKSSERSCESIGDSGFTCTDAGRLKSEETTSVTIPTTSRSTSGPSPRFVYPENGLGPSACILSSIPKLSGYPRKNRDRCLPCMYKSFEVPQERKISLPGTLLRRIIESPDREIFSPRSSGNGDSSSSSLSFMDELVESVRFDGEASHAGSADDCNAPESRIVGNPPSAFKGEEERGEEDAKRKATPDSEAPCKAITRETEEDQREDGLISKNLTDATVSLAQVASLQETGASNSLGNESSEEDESNFVSLNDDKSKPRFLVPCHAPTILAPSLEPLKALRNKKPTTLQDRIAMLESASLKKSTSIDYSDQIQQKAKSHSDKSALGKEGEGDKEKPAPPPLRKAKSDLEQLLLGEAEVRTEMQRVLRKGITLSSLPVSTDVAANESSKEHLGESKESVEMEEDTFDADLGKGNRRKLPLTDRKEIIGILKNLGENATATDMLETLCREFSARLSNDVETDDPAAKKRNKTVVTLINLLVESSRYLHPDKFPSDLRFSSNQPSSCNPEFLRRILPLETYNGIAPLLDLPEWYPRKENVRLGETAIADVAQQTPHEVSTFSSLEVQPPTPRDTESSSDEQKPGHPRYNPYGLFLTKPRRKVVTWRPLTKRDMEGYDPDTTLETRAENMMKRICQDFCEWIDSLGGTDKTIDEQVLRDMFEIDFTAEASKATQVLITEMPVVPAEVAVTRNSPGAGRLAMTTRHVRKDVKAEKTPEKTKAFGTALPWELRFVPPNNRVRERWLECPHVPIELETMDAVWKDITHLKSVRGFVEWLQRHPEVPRPEPLKKIVAMDTRTLRQIEDDETFAHLELDIDQIQSLRVAV